MYVKELLHCTETFHNECRKTDRALALMLATGAFILTAYLANTGEPTPVPHSAVMLARPASMLLATPLPDNTNTAILGPTFQTPANWTAFRAETLPATPTPEAPLVNPYKDKVWNQRCRWDPDPVTGERTVRTCAELWAASPLPGGCLDRTRIDLSPAACNLAATSYVLNALVLPEVFMKIIRQPGITPETLVNDVYPNLPSGKGTFMSCKGAGAEVIIPTLELFGLRVRTVNVSAYSAPGLVKNLWSDQLAMFSFTGNKSWQGNPAFKHWSVASGVTTFLDKRFDTTKEAVTYHDSFYYPDDDPFHPSDPDHVIFEESPDLRDDSSYTGKSIKFVGALVVSQPDQSGLPFREMDNGVLELGVNLLPPEAKKLLAAGKNPIAAYTNGQMGWHGISSITDIFTGRYDFPGKPWNHGQGYDLRLEYGHGKGFHHNVDALPGPDVVVRIGEMPDGYGNFVIIRNTLPGHNGELSVEFLYAHLGDIFVQEGQELTRDTEIGTVDKTGKGAAEGPRAGPHVHMEIWYHGEAVKMNWWGGAEKLELPGQ